MFSEEDLIKAHKERADLIGSIIAFFFLIILARLWFLQIYQGERFFQYSLQNRLRKEVVLASRGMIYSRNDELLIHNIPRFDVIVTPQYLKNKKETLKKLAKVLDMNIKSIEKILKKNQGQARYRPITIKKNLSLREVAVIETENNKMPGVRVRTFVSREYKDKEIGAHLLGYISEIDQAQLKQYRKRDNLNYKLGDFIGQAGIEEKFDLQLRGEDGYEFVEVDALGRRRRNSITNTLLGGIKNKDARPGNNIRLNIDRELQLKSFHALENKVGSVVAIDVNTGEVLAMVSRPSFDPGGFSRSISRDNWKKLVENKNNPLRDRTIQEHYSPGSTFKTITAIAALEEGIVRPDQEFMCKGTYRLGRRTYHDWSKSGHGMTDVYKALKRSVDVYFYQLAVQLDIDVLARYAKSFGFGRKTGIGLSQETSGLIPTREWKKKRNGEDWQVGETLSCVIGQSYVLVTPLQLAVAYAAVANGGTLFRPYLIREIFSPTGKIVKKYEPEIVGKVEVSAKTLKAIQKGLYKVVNEEGGTAWWYRGQGIQMAGKTGTSQVRSMTKSELFSKCEEMPYKDRHHGIFVGYAPFQDPKIAVATVIEHGCHGSTAAAPVVRDVIQLYMKKYHPDVYKENTTKERKQYRRKLKRQKKLAET